MFVCRFKMTVEDDSWNQYGILEQLDNNILIFLTIIALIAYPLIVKRESQLIGNLVSNKVFDPLTQRKVKLYSLVILNKRMG